jgi:hypothetical protein
MDVNGNYQALLPNGHQQLAILNRTAKRPSIRFEDRLFWGALAKCWQDWRYALLIVKPETVIKWRRQWFRLYWRWKSKTGRPGRPRIDTKIRELIPRISQENLLWGTPRIQSELSLLGFEVADQRHGTSDRRMDSPAVDRGVSGRHRPTLSDPRPGFDLWT